METFMKHVCTVALGAAILCLTGASTAFAHATLETKEAPASSFYKAVIRIGHGCEGTATTSMGQKAQACGKAR
jgi:periplasmic copper chaperone A